MIGLGSILGLRSQIQQMNPFRQALGALGGGTAMGSAMSQNPLRAMLDPAAPQAPQLASMQPQAPTVQTPAAQVAPLVQQESSGNPLAQNDAVGHGGQRGHFGYLQFGHARLQDAKNAGIIPQSMTPQQFMRDEGAQARVGEWHFADIDRQAQKRGLTARIGETIGGVPITQDSIRAMAHLGGTGGAANFINSGGKANPADANGTRLSDYGRKFAAPGSTGAPTGQPAASAPTKVNFTFRGASPLGVGNTRGSAEQELAKVNPKLTQAVEQAFSSLGISDVRINSGHRDAARNAKAGGAKGSQHLHGNAFDIDVSQYTPEQRVQIIGALSAAGIGGLGIGANIIHADVGARRAWGYATSAGGGAVPDWAADAIARHKVNGFANGGTQQIRGTQPTSGGAQRAGFTEQGAPNPQPQVTAPSRSPAANWAELAKGLERPQQEAPGRTTSGNTAPIETPGLAPMDESVQSRGKEAVANVRQIIYDPQAMRGMSDAAKLDILAQYGAEGAAVDPTPRTARRRRS